MGIRFFPPQPVFLWCLNYAVAQPLCLVPRHHKLHSGEEPADKLLSLIRQILPNAFGYRNRGTFQLQHTERDTVDVEHKVRSLKVVSFETDLLCNAEIVVIAGYSSRLARQ